MLPLVFFFMTANKKRHCYPLYFIWQRQQCYPLCFFSWRPIKNNSDTPYVSFNKNDSVTHYGFFHDDQRKTTVSPPMFYLINIDSVIPYVYFMTADKKRQLPLMFFPCWPIKTRVVPPLTFLRGSEPELFRVLTSELINAPSRHRINSTQWLYLTL